MCRGPDESVVTTALKTIKIYLNFSIIFLFANQGSQNLYSIPFMSFNYSILSFVFRLVYWNVLLRLDIS